MVFPPSPHKYNPTPEAFESGGTLHMVVWVLYHVKNSGRVNVLGCVVRPMVHQDCMFPPPYLLTTSPLRVLGAELIPFHNFTGMKSVHQVLQKVLSMDEMNDLQGTCKVRLSERLTKGGWVSLSRLLPTSPPI